MKIAVAVCFALSVFLMSAGPARAGIKEELEEARVAFYRYEFEAALSLYLPLAQLGESEAQEKIGEMYLYGMGIYRDCDKAQDWLGRAANQKNPRAAWLLGRVYDDGKCVNKNNLRAYMWYSVAADMVPRPAPPKPEEGYVVDFYPLPAFSGNKDDAANKALLRTIEIDRKVLGEVMTHDQIAEAAQLAKDWKPQTNRN